MPGAEGLLSHASIPSTRRRRVGLQGDGKMERLQKVMARAGIASRRHCEQLIVQGRVKVDGKVVDTLGSKVSPAAQICVDGVPLSQPTQVYYLLNKPAGYVATATDTHGRPTVMDLLPRQPRVWPVGRLDMDTRGLLLATNDGELTNGLLHPSRGIPKTYRVTGKGPFTSVSLQKMQQGLNLEDGRTAPAKAVLRQRQGNEFVIDLTLTEGRNRQVKRMLSALGCRVTSLERTSLGFLTLEGVERGKFRQLTSQEVSRLKKMIDGGSNF